LKNFIDHEFKKLNRVQIDGVRYYDTGDGKYPSVTTVTGLLSKDSIAAWRKRVGEEEANRVSSRASKRGTEIHSLCEHYLKDEVVEPNMFDAPMFNSMKPILNNIDNIHALESPLYSHKLRVAGTVDCIAEYNGVLSVIDFKTSGRIKSRDDIHGYFLQTSAYGYMFWEQTKLSPTQIVIIMGVDNEDPLVFIEPITPWLPKFIDVRNQFKQLKGY
jgi:genome maintenance exonuclease 1